MVETSYSILIAQESSWVSSMLHPAFRTARTQQVEGHHLGWEVMPNHQYILFRIKWSEIPKESDYIPLNYAPTTE